MKKMIFRLEEERRHIARELHDELGQRLTALKMELASLLMPAQAQEGVPGVPHDRIEAMLGMVDDTMASVRRIAANLRPTMLDDLGLHAAIEWLASESSRRVGIQVAVHFEEPEPPISAAASIVLYRIVQEALTNVARHAPGHGRADRVVAARPGPGAQRAGQWHRLWRRRHRRIIRLA